MRAKRLAHLFKDEESEDDEDILLAQKLDAGAAYTDINNLMDKVDVHLKVEMNILKKWQEKDKQQTGNDNKDNLKQQSSVQFIPASGITSPIKAQPFGQKMNQTSHPSLNSGSGKWSSPQLNQNSERSERSASIKKSHEETLSANRLKRQSSSIGKFNSFMQKIKGKAKAKR